MQKLVRVKTFCNENKACYYRHSKYVIEFLLKMKGTLFRENGKSMFIWSGLSRNVLECMEKKLQSKSTSYKSENTNYRLTDYLLID